MPEETTSSTSSATSSGAASSGTSTTTTTTTTTTSSSTPKPKETKASVPSGKSGSGKKSGKHSSSKPEDQNFDLEEENWPDVDVGNLIQGLDEDIDKDMDPANR